MVKLVGYNRFTSKKNGKDYCVAHVLKDLNEREKDSGFVGAKVDSFFMPEKLYDLLKPTDVGKEVVLEYELSGTRAYLVDVKVK